MQSRTLCKSFLLSIYSQSQKTFTEYQVRTILKLKVTGETRNWTIFFLILISGLGQIPKVAFVLDTEYLYLQQMDQLFAELEKQPGKGPSLLLTCNI